MLPKPKDGILAIAPYVGGKSTAAPGVRVVKLSSNETPLGASAKAIEAYKQAASQLHRYPDGNATALREAIAAVYKLPAERIVCGAGSDELIGLLIHAYAGAGDEVLFCEHGFLMYKIYALSAGATPVTAPEHNLTTDVDALLAAVTAATRVVLVANPNNPTGSYIPASELARLRAGLREDILLVLDGAYAEYATQADYSCGMELAESTQNSIVLRTFSKIYGLSSLRIGWAYGPANILDVLNRVRGPFNVSGPAIAAGIAAVQDVAFTDETRAFNTQWLNWLSAQLAKIGLKPMPSIANFVLVEFPEGKHSAANANAYLMERGLIVREVGNYGLPNYLRISIGLPEDNQAIIATLTAFLAS